MPPAGVFRTARRRAGPEAYPGPSAAQGGRHRRPRTGGPLS
ncbi:hypothetical protein SLNWT_5129 [Streptomyces albus]|uniref:Uncharacterized protein n=1 Tax=Streptomyces albus (strain ATCC 21838 / DSM 41398 / FERM P-419 / JCM 4703 / NBRC 107858) TaxID=1081613 RepID=A0A0B5F1P0_STRA4|nr:hypothetical protein SLNWT_5129 [Streptomyces albus]AOU79808.1 hypothetical protein SLNHY_5117 [Streptomyces albus]